jgi:hypothetical protein
MGTGRRLVGTAVFAVFVGAFVVRPILSNPAVVAALDGGVLGWETLVAVPTVLVGLLLVALRLGWLSGSEKRAQSGTEHAQAPRTEWVEGIEEAQSEASDDDTDNGDTDIEEEPPDAPLDLHLDHLRAELDGEREVARDLEAFAEVAETTDSGPIPQRCPHDDCEALWTERTVLDITNGRYELLDDGTILCLDCERTVTVE